jgi:hypothetical protein
VVGEPAPNTAPDAQPARAMRNFRLFAMACGKVQVQPGGPQINQLGKNDCQIAPDAWAFTMDIRKHAIARFHESN